MTEALTLDRLRLSASSSSRSMEETVVPSRLSPQASIAGQSLRTPQLEEWDASLERLGHERSRFKEVLTDIRSVTEALVWGKLPETRLPAAWVVETGQPLGRMCFTRLVSHHPVCSGLQSGECTYVLRLEPTAPPNSETGEREDRASEAWAALQRAHSRLAAQTRLRHAELDEQLFALDSEDEPEPAECLGQGGEAWEPVVPDTDRAYTIQQMAQAWKAIGRPITEDDVSLSVDPDDYPLF